MGKKSQVSLFIILAVLILLILFFFTKLVMDSSKYIDENNQKQTLFFEEVDYVNEYAKACYAIPSTNNLEFPTINSKAFRIDNYIANDFAQQARMCMQGLKYFKKVQGYSVHYTNILYEINSQDPLTIHYKFPITVSDDTLKAELSDSYQEYPIRTLQLQKLLNQIFVYKEKENLGIPINLDFSQKFGFTITKIVPKIRTSSKESYIVYYYLKDNKYANTFILPILYESPKPILNINENN